MRVKLMAFVGARANTPRDQTLSPPRSSVGLEGVGSAKSPKFADPAAPLPKLVWDNQHLCPSWFGITNTSAQAG